MSAQPCSLLHLLLCLQLLHTLLFITLCRGTCRGWHRDVYTSQPGPSAACKCLSVIHSSLVTARFVMLLCFMLTERKEQQEDKQLLWVQLSDCVNDSVPSNLPAIIDVFFLLTCQLKCKWSAVVLTVWHLWWRRISPFHLKEHKYTEHTFCTLLLSTLSLIWCLSFII